MSFSCFLLWGSAAQTNAKPGAPTRQEGFWGQASLETQKRLLWLSLTNIQPPKEGGKLEAGEATKRATTSACPQDRDLWGLSDCPFHGELWGGRIRSPWSFTWGFLGCLIQVLEILSSLQAHVKWDQRGRTVLIKGGCFNLWIEGTGLVPFWRKWQEPKTRISDPSFRFCLFCPMSYSSGGGPLHLKDGNDRCLEFLLLAGSSEIVQSLQ